MCRNIRPLFNFDPPATKDEIHDASLQYVRKISGFAKPSRTNQEAFDEAVDQIARASAKLLAAMSTSAPSKDRETEAQRRRERSAARFPRA